MNSLCRDLNIWPAKIKILKSMHYDWSKNKNCITRDQTAFISEIYVLSYHKVVGFPGSKCYASENKRRWFWLNLENLYELVDEGAIEIL